MTLRSRRSGLRTPERRVPKVQAVQAVQETAVEAGALVTFASSRSPQWGPPSGTDVVRAASQGPKVGSRTRGVRGQGHRNGVTRSSVPVALMESQDIVVLRAALTQPALSLSLDSRLWSLPMECSLLLQQPNMFLDDG